MCIAEWVKIPTPISLAVIAALLTLSVAASLLWPIRDPEA
jgi:hypothetical protein